MRKNIFNHKHLALVVSMAAVLVLSGCTEADETKNDVTKIDVVVETKNTEGYVSGTELEMTKTEIIKTESVESKTDEAGGTETDETGGTEAAESGETEITEGRETETAETAETESTGTNDSGTWIPPHEGMVYVWEAGRWMEPEEAETYNKPADGFDRGIAEQIWEYVNAERVAAGLNSLAWDEKVYDFACRRAQEIVTDFSHNGNDSNYAENILGPSRNGDPYYLHMVWYNSSGHHSNYMSPNHIGGACAVYVHDGLYYAVENFTLAKGYYMANNTTREFNGQILDITATEAEAFDKGNYWVASNGVVVFILDNGNISAGDGFHTLEELQTAVNEYYATHENQQ